VPDVRKLDLNLIVVLDALLAECNLTKAGKRVGMTQPAVSGALNRLRELFGDQLLERDGRSFVLTPRAESLIPEVVECMAQVRRTFGLLPEFDAATSTRTFQVTAGDYVLAELASPLIRLLQREAPGTRVEFVDMPATRQFAEVDLLRTDLTIAGTGRKVPGKQSALFSDSFVCLVDAGNDALGAGRLSFDALGALRWVKTVFGPHTSTHIDEMLAGVGLDPAVAATVPGYLPVPFALAGTPWVGWVPERTATRYAAALGLVAAKVPIEPRVLIEAAHWHPSKAGDPAMQWLVTKLREASEVVEFGDESQFAHP
jgi:LysR family nod box-dependent transcriptional activator